MQGDGRSSGLGESELSAELASSKRALATAEEAVEELRGKVIDLQDENGALHVRLLVDSAYGQNCTLVAPCFFACKSNPVAVLMNAGYVSCAEHMYMLPAEP